MTFGTLGGTIIFGEQTGFARDLCAALPFLGIFILNNEKLLVCDSELLKGADYDTDGCHQKTQEF